jgi:hypothetical protein
MVTDETELAADPAPARAGVPDGITTLLFDVLGTVVDEGGSIAAEASVALAAAGADPDAGPRLGGEWMRCLDALIDQVRTGEAPWRSSQVLRRAALDDAARAAGLDGLPPAVLNDLARAAHPWDLRAAAQHGMRPGYVARPGEAAPGAGDRFDVHAQDFADLALLLAPGAG